MLMGTSLHVRPRTRTRSAKIRGSMSDLLTRIATDRSEDAFRKLFTEFGPRIRRYMMQKGADSDLAEELAQETLITVWRKAALYSAEKGSPSTWIYTIARNLRIDRIRRERAWQELTDEQASSIPSEEDQPDVVADRSQQQVRVQAALQELPPEQQEVVILAFIEGLPHSEIAERLSLPLGTVKSRIRLAYSKLRNALEELK